jgi:hypothetical protein
VKDMLPIERRTAEHYRRSLPTLRALTRYLRQTRRDIQSLPTTAGYELWLQLEPTCFTDQPWQLMAGPRGSASEAIPARGRFDAVAAARRLLARARDSAACKKGATP